MFYLCYHMRAIKRGGVIVKDTIQNKSNFNDTNNPIKVGKNDILLLDLDSLFSKEEQDNYNKKIEEDLGVFEKKCYYPKPSIHNADAVLDIINNSVEEKYIRYVLSIYCGYNKYGFKEGNSMLRNIYSGKVYDYLMRYCDVKGSSDYTAKSNSLRLKLSKALSFYKKILRDYRTEKNRIEKLDLIDKDIDKSTELITDFINSGLTIKDYLEKYNISEGTFKKILSSIERKNLELFNKYKEYIENNNSKRYAVLVEKNRKIIELIKNGIPTDETNENRPFDILDYYEKSNISLEHFLEISKDICDATDLRIVRIFYNKNKYTKSEIPLIKKMKYSINSILLTDEDKDKIIDYLKSINAPVNILTFRIAATRYINNELFNGTNDNPVLSLNMQ